MRKTNYLRYRRLLSISKEVLRLFFMILGIILVIRSI
jgi:hypothetical protein